jgi:hypothetical protein
MLTAARIPPSLSPTTAFPRVRYSTRVPSALSASLRSSIHDLIDDTAVEATHLVFAAQEDPRARRVSFDQFGQWYNSQGYLVLPWLELLDLTKWPFPSAEGGAGGSAASSDAGQAEAPPSNGGEGGAAPDAALVFELSEDCKDLELTVSDIQVCVCGGGGETHAPLPREACVFGGGRGGGVCRPVPPVVCVPERVCAWMRGYACPPFLHRLQRFRDLVSVSGLDNVRPKALLQHLLACMEASGDVDQRSYMTAEAFGNALTSIFSMDTLRKQFSVLSDHTVGSALMTVFDAFGTYGGEVCMAWPALFPTPVCCVGCALRLPCTPHRCRQPCAHPFPTLSASSHAPGGGQRVHVRPAAAVRGHQERKAVLGLLLV